MENKIKLAIVGVTAVILTIATAIFSPGASGLESSVQKIVDLPPMDVPTAEGHPGMESVLNRLVEIYTIKGLESAKEFAILRKIDMKGDRLQVVLDARIPFSPSLETLQMGSRETREAAINRAVSIIKSEIERFGGKVEKSYQYLVRCGISIQSLTQLARISQVRSIRRPIKPHPHVTSEGVQNSGAHLFNDLPDYKSTGVKVCILDVGFESYQDLLGTELPESVTTRSFTDEGDIEAGEVHGTACAEIVHDMAPDAELYFANIYWDTDLIDAVNWIIEQDVDVISYSLGYYWGAGDGTGFESSLARQAQAAGVTWVTSTGNSADDHWSGTFNDPDSDGWHNFSGEDEILQFYVPADYGYDYGVDAYLKWNDWGIWDDFSGYSGSNQDFDLYLFIWNGTGWQLVDTSKNRQPQFKWPWESIEGWYSEKDTYWGVAIKKHQATQNVYFDLYIPTHSRGTMEYNVPEGSVTSPADSPYVISVGAVDALENYYHFYSSRGPTLDGRLKPDICAPSAISVSETTYGSISNTGGFAGTSASCPHVAGAIALLKSKTPFTIDDIITIIYSRVIDMGESGHDNIYGRGRLNLRR